MTHEEMCYTSKELLDFSHLYKQKSRELEWEWVLKVVLDNGGKEHKCGSG